MTLREFLDLWSDWNIPLVLNNDELNPIVRFDMISDFGFRTEENKEIHDRLQWRKVISAGIYEGELCIRLADHNIITWDRMCEIASKAIDGLREDGETEAQEYLWNEVEITEPFEREFFGLGEYEEHSTEWEGSMCNNCPYWYKDCDDDYAYCHFDAGIHPTPSPCEE